MGDFMKKFLFFTLMLTGFLYSESTNFVHHIGFWAGGTTSVGLSYRYKPSDWSIQFAFLPYYVKEDVFFSIGGSFQKYLVETDWTALLLYVGVSGLYNIYNSGYYDSDDNWKTERRVFGSVNIGFGPGFELKILDRFVVALNVGYGFFYQYQPSSEIIINFTAEGGIYYRF